MPNRDVHLPVGAVFGVAYATYHAWGQPGPYVLAEAAGGLVGGIGEGCSPTGLILHVLHAIARKRTA